MRYLPLTLLSLVLVACTERQPAAPDIDGGFNAAVTFNERGLPFTFETQMCGETQLWEGVDHWIEQYTETPSGRVLTAFRTNYSATVVGVPSGNVYKLNGHFEARDISDFDGYPYKYVGVENDVLIGHGGVPNITLHGMIMVTISAPGDVVVDRFVRTVKCQ